MIASGGACFFLIGLYAAYSLMCNFDANLLAKLAASGMGLKLDFCGGPGK